MLDVVAWLTGAWKLMAAVTASTYCLLAIPRAVVGSAATVLVVRVIPVMLVYVVPDAMVVEPRVGAEYEAVVEIACQAEPLHAYIMFVPVLKYVAPVISALPWLSSVGAEANEPR